MRGAANAALEDIATLTGLLAFHAHSRGERIAIEDGRQCLSFAQFHARTEVLAASLVALGLRRSDRVAFLGRNSAAYFELLFAAARMGGVVVPIGVRLTPSEIARIIADAGPAVMFVDAELRDLVTGCQMNVKELASEGDPFARWRNGDALVHDEPEPSAAVLQIYTSGTTGDPKGVMLSHANLLQQRVSDMRGGVPWGRWLDDDVSLVSMPISHVSGSGWGLYGFFHGARTVIVRDFDADRILDLIADARITKIFVVPAALQQMVEAQARAPRTLGLRHILYGGAPISRPLLDQVRVHFARADLVQLYGMTESSGSAVALFPDDHNADDERLLLAAGRALPGVRIAVADVDTGRILGAGSGEVLIQGPGVMLGYWGKPESTLEAIDKAGWLHTGDVGELAADGLLTIRDRLKDLIITGGENVYPGEVEGVLCLHPGVAEVAVVGLPDPVWGEAVTAFVVRRVGAALDAEDLRAWSRDRIAAFKSPRRVHFVSALPRNASGKILRKALRQNEHAEAASMPAYREDGSGGIG